MRHKKQEKKTTNKKNEFCLISKHEQAMKYFQNSKKRIKDIDAEIKTLIDNPKLKKMTTLEAERKIIELQEEQCSLKNGEMENEYFVNTINILNEYITIVDRLESEHDSELKKKKNDLILEYLKITRDSSLLNFNYNLRLIEECKICGEEMIYDNATYICEKCDYTKETINFSEELSYKERQTCDIKVPYKYEKEGYLEEYIKRLEAKENKIIPQYILDEVLIQLKREGKVVLNLITEKQIKNCLKQIGHQEYYENVINIINKINGRPNFVLSNHLKEQLRTMFKKIQEPFFKYKPKERKSFFSYPYILYQFFKILDLNHYCVYFPLLKSEEKLRAQDEIFKKVIEDLQENDTESNIKWVFNPTI